MSGPTLRQFEKELRRAIRKIDRIGIKSHAMNAGEIHYEGDDIVTLWIDPFWAGIGPTTIHELIHYLRRELDGTRGQLDEPETLGTDAAMWDLISNDPKLYPFWRRQIYKRLPAPFQEVL